MYRWVTAKGDALGQSRIVTPAAAILIFALPLVGASSAVAGTELTSNSDTAGTQVATSVGAPSNSTPGLYGALVESEGDIRATIPGPSPASGESHPIAREDINGQWQLSRVLTTPDRWSNPLPITSQDGSRGALWQERLTDDTSRILASVAQAGIWTEPQELGQLNPKRSEVVTWPESHRMTASWLDEDTTCDSSPACPAINRLGVARVDESGRWQNTIVIIPTRSVRGPNQQLEETIRTLNSGQTTGVLFDGETPFTILWPANPVQTQIEARPTTNWPTLESDHSVSFSIGADGSVWAFLDGPTGLELHFLDGTRWGLVATVKPAEEYKPVPQDAPQYPRGGQLVAVARESGVTLAWQQLDAKYAEDYQVWSGHVFETGQTEVQLVQELIRPGNWTNGEPRIQMDVSDDGLSCLTIPTAPYGLTVGLTGSDANWSAPVDTDVTLTRYVPVGSLTATKWGCVHDGGTAWFKGSNSGRLPSPDWSFPPTATGLPTTNFAGTVHLAAAGTDQLQIAWLTEKSPPLVTAPGAVRDMSARQKKKSLTFTWREPEDLGGSDSCAYEWRIGKGQWKTTTRPRVTIRLGNRKVVAFRVRAVTQVGPGPTTVVRWPER